MASLAGLFGNNKGFNAATVEPTQDYQPMRAGIYKAIISASSIEQSKSGNGTNLVLTFKIVEGEYKNREQRVWLGVQHTNEIKQKIDQSHFSAICYAVGQIQVTTTEQLHGKPLLIRVVLKPHWQDIEKLQNEVTAYMPLQQTASQPENSFAAPGPMAGEEDFAEAAPW